MIVSIKIPDETYEKVGKLNPQNPRHAIEQLIEKYADHGYSSKSIVLSGQALARLQDLLGVPVDSPAGLVELVQRAVSVKVDGVDVPLTQSQRKGVADNAAFYKQDPAKFLETKIKQGLQAVLGV